MLPLVLPCAVKHEAVLLLSSMLCERLSGSWHTSVSQIAAAVLGHDCVSDLWLGVPVTKALVGSDCKHCFVTFRQHKWG